MIDPKTESDLLALIANKVQESIHLDYKASDSLATPKGLNELSKDVSAFANSDGGVLIYGIKENAIHEPGALDNGLPSSIVSKEQIEAKIHSNTSPRIGRCSDAAREIRDVIGESAGAVADGGKLVAEAAGTIDRAAESVGSVSEVIGDIARASREQSSGIEGIGKAIQQLDGMTQQNAALVEQTGAAARSFEEQVSTLREAAALFKLDRSEARDVAVSLVQRGVRHIEAKGPDTAFRDFEDKKGRFVRGDHYLWVCDMKGVVKSYALMPKMRGQDRSELRDAQGKPFIRDILRIAQARGRGWVDYQWINPVTKKEEPKSTYFERSGSLVVLCGIYRHDAPEPARVLPQQLVITG